MSDPVPRLFCKSPPLLRRLFAPVRNLSGVTYVVTFTPANPAAVTPNLNALNPLSPQQTHVPTRSPWIRFSPNAHTFSGDAVPLLSPRVVREFVIRALSDRCRTEKSQRKYSALTLEYITFANTHQHPLPQIGDEALVTVTLRLGSLKTRGFSAPGHGKYAIKAFAEPLGIPFPIYHPTVIAAAKTKRNKPLRQAP